MQWNTKRLKKEVKGMDNLRLCESDYRFMSVVWDNEPVASGKLVELCADRLGWKKSTTYTVLKRLCDKGIFQNEAGMVTSRISLWAFDKRLLSPGEGWEISCDCPEDEYDLVVFGQDIITVNVTDYDKKKAEEGYINGTFEIAPAKAIMDSITPMLSMNDVPEEISSLVTNGLKLKLVLTGDASKSAVAVSIVSGSDEMITFSANINFKDQQKVTIPSEYVDATNEEALEKYEAKEVIDLEGKTVLPGMGDSHMHFFAYCQTFTTVDLGGAKSKAEAIARLAAKAAETPEGEWIKGSNFDQSKWDDCEDQIPTRHDLDMASTKHPIVIKRVCLHTAVANTMAIEKAELYDNFIAKAKAAFAEKYGHEPVVIPVVISDGARKLA